MKHVLKPMILLISVACFVCASFSVSAQGGINDPVAPLPTIPIPEQVESSGPAKPCPDGDIVLNTEVPFVGRCIKKSLTTTTDTTTIANVFPKLTGKLIRLVMTIIIIIGFFGILIGGFMITADGAIGTKAQGKQLIITVISGFIILSVTGIILNLINPNFFGTASWLIFMRR